MRATVLGPPCQPSPKYWKYFKYWNDSTDENNCAGVLGIANVLTEYGKVDEAKEIYKLLSTSEPDSEIGLHAMINQAHLLMDDQNREYAINLYQAVLEHQPDNLQVAMYLCKAYYK